MINYKLIYYYFLKILEKRNEDAIYYAAVIVFCFQVIHMFIVFAIIKKLFKLDFPVFSNTYFFNKLFYMPFLLIWLILVYRFFKKHSEGITKIYVERNIVTTENSVLIFLIFFVPLISGIILSTK